MRIGCPGSCNHQFLCIRPSFSKISLSVGYGARCQNVVDGDTIDVTADLGFRVAFEHRVGFHGLNAYEMNDSDAAKRSLTAKGKTYVAAKIGGKDSIMNTFKDQAEKYGRWLAVVYYTGDDGAWHKLNDELLAAGLAVRYA